MRRTWTTVLWALVAAVAAGGCTTTPREGVDEKFNFLPLARYETSESPPGHTVDVLWPLIQFHRAGDAGASRFLPLYYHDYDGAGSSFLDLLVLYWQSYDAPRDEIRRTLFPLFHSVRSPSERNTHLWPVYGHREYGGEDFPSVTDSFAWPLVTYDRAKNGERSSLGVLSLGPLLSGFCRDRRPESTHVDLLSVLGGVFAVVDSTTREPDAARQAPGAPATSWFRLLSLAPVFDLFRHEREGDKTTTRAVGLFDVPWAALFARIADAGEDGTPSIWTHLFPLYFRRDAADGESWLVPLVYGRSSREDGYERTWIVPPLAGFDRDPTTDASGVDVLWPLWRYESRGGDDPGHHLRLLPLLWFTKRPDALVQIVLPLFYRIRDAHSEYTHLIPLWGRHVEDDGRRTRSFVVPPLYVGTTDERERLSRHDVLWPLGRFETTEDSSRNYFFPLFYQHTHGERSHVNALLLFDRDASEIHSKTMLYPLVSSAEALGEGERTSLLPVFDLRYLSDAKPAGDELSVLFPLATFHRDGLETTNWIFPFLWWLDDGVRERHRHVWPLFGLDEDGDHVRWSTLFPLFFRGANFDGSVTETGYLWPLGSSETNPTESVHWLFPLYYHRNTTPESGGGSTFTWVLWPLFSRETKSTGERRWHSLFYLLRNERDPGDDGAEEFSVLGGFYRSRTERDRYTNSTAFLYGYENDGGARTLRLFHLIPIRF